MTLRGIFGSRAALVLGVALASSLAWAQVVPAPVANSGLPLHARLAGLNTSLRVLQIAAHPGDEDEALMLALSRQGAELTLLTLTRGERQVSRFGIVAPSEQALTRSMEQVAADAHSGTAQRFTRLVDFGFARKADEVFDRWLGHDTALADMVRVIRETRPDVVLVPFDPASPDGDGQHAATIILAREAFQAAADEKRFPEQLKNGLEPWQPRRLFALVHGEDATFAFDASARGEHEAQSWLQLEQAALAEEASQAGLWHAPREAARRYRMIDSAAGYAMSSGAVKLSAGMDTRLESLASEAELSRGEQAQVLGRLRAMSAAAVAAAESAGNRETCAANLAEYLSQLRALQDRLAPVFSAESAVRGVALLRVELESKRHAAEAALLQVAGVTLAAQRVGNDSEPWVVTPGEEFAVEARIDADPSVRVARVELIGEGSRWSALREWREGARTARFTGRVPLNAPYTRPQYLLDNEEDAAYRTLDERNATRALPPPAARVEAELEIAGELVRASADVTGTDGARLQRLMVAPAVSVVVEPRLHWNRFASLVGEVEVRVRNNADALDHGLLSVHAPTGWHVEPEHEVLEIARKGEEHGYRFYMVQDNPAEGIIPVRAVVRWRNQVYDQGYAEVRTPLGETGFDFRDSEGSLRTARMEAAENLHVGYVGLPGDVIPGTLRDLGVRVTELDRLALLNAPLTKYWAIVLGPGAVDARDELSEARSRLLEYAQSGGTIVILSQTDAERFARNAPLPFSLELGTEQVSNEASAVELIDAREPLLMEPNELGDADFRGWQEERGHNFARRWDGRFRPLLRLNDPGQPAQEGALLYAHYGRGWIIYSGLNFTRQAQGGVAGAMRLLINLLSPSAELHR
ncbi:MAG: PIG-L family deacetylase [Acidobacteriota bacterium]|nr:PIG-L family deacetylase [Acidobacteriota bacterium]